MPVFLVTLHTDLRVRKLVERPMKLMWTDGYGIQVEVIPKEFIVCDACNTRVGVTEKEVEEEGLSVGYAVCDEEAVLEVVCQKCRNRYFSGCPSFKSLEDAGL